MKRCGQQWNISSDDIERFRFYNLVYKGFMVKLLRADGGCLGTRRRRRTWKAAISFGEPLTGFDPEISEWGNPVEYILYHRVMNT